MKIPTAFRRKDRSDAAGRSLGRAALWMIAGLTGLLNLLMLVGPLHMLLVYEHGLGGAGLALVVELTALALGLLVFMAIFDQLRLRLCHRAVIAATEDCIAHDASAVGRLRALALGPSLAALADLPFTPLFFLAMALLHPSLGLLALLGAGGMALVLAMAAQRGLRHGAQHAHAQAPLKALEGLAHHAPALAQSLGRALRQNSTAALRPELDLADHLARIGAVQRAMRQGLQTLCLAAGAVLVLMGEMGAGAMIAATLFFGRGLQPLEILSSQAPQLRACWADWRRLRRIADAADQTAPTIASLAQLRMPRLEVLLTPQQGSAFALDLQAGMGLGVIGAEGAGKSTFLHQIVQGTGGVSARLNGQEIAQMDPAMTDRLIGYAPQEASLPDWPLADLIRRHQGPCRADALAATMAEFDLPPLHQGLRALAAGARRRVWLARAFFDAPALILLDEPAAHLDATGMVALDRAVRAARARGAIVMIASHSRPALAACDRGLILMGGQVVDYGPIAQIWARLSPASLDQAKNERA